MRKATLKVAKPRTRTEPTAIVFRSRSSPSSSDICGSVGVQSKPSMSGTVSFLSPNLTTNTVVGTVTIPLGLDLTPDTRTINTLSTTVPTRTGASCTDP